MDETTKPSNEGSGIKKNYKELQTVGVSNAEINQRIGESAFFDLLLNAVVYDVKDNMRIYSGDQTGSSATDSDAGSVIETDDTTSVKLEKLIQTGVVIFPFTPITQKQNNKRIKAKAEANRSKDSEIGTK